MKRGTSESAVEILADLPPARAPQLLTRGEFGAPIDRQTIVAIACQVLADGGDEGTFAMRFLEELRGRIEQAGGFDRRRAAEKA
jgi:hypothetical protein